ncbi:hypothetical protein VNO77_34445 [Canavalia gladiata]|uniref:Uncharacterized protein n=1 Tax=Canavalia gladiata TaxID=3824 RepID=A0AAN9KGE6_CANGL
MTFLMVSLRRISLPNSQMGNCHFLIFDQGVAVLSSGGHTTKDSRAWVQTPPSTLTLTEINTSSDSSTHTKSLTLEILVLTTCSQTSNLIVHDTKARAPGRELCEAINRMRLYHSQ